MRITLPRSTSPTAAPDFTSNDGLRAPDDDVFDDLPPPPRPKRPRSAASRPLRGGSRARTRDGNILFGLILMGLGLFIWPVILVPIGGIYVLRGTEDRERLAASVFVIGVTLVVLVCWGFPVLKYANRVFDRSHGESLAPAPVNTRNTPPGLGPTVDAPTAGNAHSAVPGPSTSPQTTAPRGPWVEPRPPRVQLRPGPQFGRPNLPGIRRELPGRNPGPRPGPPGMPSGRPF
jgi:hypothetical protein